MLTACNFNGTLETVKWLVSLGASVRAQTRVRASLRAIVSGSLRACVCVM